MRLFFLGICIWAGAVLSLAGCHYSEEERWSVCCVTHILPEATASSAARTTIISWQRLTLFDGDGRAGDGGYGSRSFDSYKNHRIKSEIANFLADNPTARATDYLAGLEMTCGADPTISKAGRTRCDLELPIWVQCGPTYRFLPGTTPIPGQLQKPLPALLRMRIDLSGNTVLETFTHIDPVPGGHLCHR